MKNFPEIKQQIESFGYQVKAFDFERPWGGFLVIEETQAQKFADQFFEGVCSNYCHPDPRRVW